MKSVFVFPLFLLTLSCFLWIHHRSNPVSVFPLSPTSPHASVWGNPRGREGAEGSMNKSLTLALRLCDHWQPVQKHASSPPLAPSAPSALLPKTMKTSINKTSETALFCADQCLVKPRQRTYRHRKHPGLMPPSL